MIDPPSNFHYDVTNQRLSWDPVTGAVEYEIAHGPQGYNDWITVFSDGDSNHIPFSVASGKHEVKGKARGGGGWGIWGAIEVVTVP